MTSESRILARLSPEELKNYRRIGEGLKPTWKPKPVRNWGVNRTGKKARASA